MIKNKKLQKIIKTGKYLVLPSILASASVLAFSGNMYQNATKEFASKWSNTLSGLMEAVKEYEIALATGNTALAQKLFGLTFNNITLSSYINYSALEQYLADNNANGFMMQIPNLEVANPNAIYSYKISLSQINENAWKQMPPWLQNIALPLNATVSQIISGRNVNQVVCLVPAKIWLNIFKNPPPKASVYGLDINGTYATCYEIIFNVGVNQTLQSNYISNAGFNLQYGYGTTFYDTVQQANVTNTLYLGSSASGSTTSWNGLTFNELDNSADYGWMPVSNNTYLPYTKMGVYDLGNATFNSTALGEMAFLAGYFNKESSFIGGFSDGLMTKLVNQMGVTNFNYPNQAIYSINPNAVDTEQFNGPTFAKSSDVTDNFKKPFYVVNSKNEKNPLIDYQSEVNASEITGAKSDYPSTYTSYGTSQGTTGAFGSSLQYTAPANMSGENSAYAYGQWLASVTANDNNNGDTYGWSMLPRVKKYYSFSMNNEGVGDTLYANYVSALLSNVNDLSSLGEFDSSKFTASYTPNWVATLTGFVIQQTSIDTLFDFGLINIADAAGWAALSAASIDALALNYEGLYSYLSIPEWQYADSSFDGTFNQTFTMMNPNQAFHTISILNTSNPPWSMNFGPSVDSSASTLNKETAKTPSSTFDSSHNPSNWTEFMSEIVNGWGGLISGGSILPVQQITQAQYVWNAQFILADGSISSNYAMGYTYANSDSSSLNQSNVESISQIAWDGALMQYSSTDNEFNTDYGVQLGLFTNGTPVGITFDTQKYLTPSDYDNLVNQFYPNTSDSQPLTWTSNQINTSSPYNNVIATLNSTSTASVSLGLLGSSTSIGDTTLSELNQSMQNYFEADTNPSDSNKFVNLDVNGGVWTKIASDVLNETLSNSSTYDFIYAEIIANKKYLINSILKDSVFTKNFGNLSEIQQKSLANAYSTMISNYLSSEYTNSNKKTIISNGSSSSSDVSTKSSLTPSLTLSYPSFSDITNQQTLLTYIQNIYDNNWLSNNLLNNTYYSNSSNSGLAINTSLSDLISILKIFGINQNSTISEIKSNLKTSNLSKNALITDITNEITSLQNTITELKAQNKSLKTTNGTLTSDVASLSNKVSSLQKTISDDESSIIRLKNLLKTATTTAQKTKFEDEINQYQTKITDLQTQIKTYNSQIKTDTATITTNQTKINANQTTITNDGTLITNYQTNISNIETFATKLSSLFQQASSNNTLSTILSTLFTISSNQNLTINDIQTLFAFLSSSTIQQDMKIFDNVNYTQIANGDTANNFYNVITTLSQNIQNTTFATSNITQSLYDLLNIAVGVEVNSSSSSVTAYLQKEGYQTAGGYYGVFNNMSDGSVASVSSTSSNNTDSSKTGGDSPYSADALSQWLSDYGISTSSSQINNLQLQKIDESTGKMLDIGDTLSDFYALASNSSLIANYLNTYLKLSLNSASIFGTLNEYNGISSYDSDVITSSNLTLNFDSMFQTATSNVVTHTKDETAIIKGINEYQSDVSQKSIFQYLDASQNTISDSPQWYSNSGSVSSAVANSYIIGSSTPSNPSGTTFYQSNTETNFLQSTQTSLNVWTLPMFSNGANVIEPIQSSPANKNPTQVQNQIYQNSNTLQFNQWINTDGVAFVNETGGNYSNGTLPNPSYISYSLDAFPVDIALGSNAPLILDRETYQAVFSPTAPSFLSNGISVSTKNNTLTPLYYQNFNMNSNYAYVSGETSQIYAGVMGFSASPTSNSLNAITTNPLLNVNGTISNNGSSTNSANQLYDAYQITDGSLTDYFNQQPFSASQIVNNNDVGYVLNYGANTYSNYSSIKNLISSLGGNAISVSNSSNTNYSNSSDSSLSNLISNQKIQVKIYPSTFSSYWNYVNWKNSGTQQQINSLEWCYSQYNSYNNNDIGQDITNDNGTYYLSWNNAVNPNSTQGQDFTFSSKNSFLKNTTDAVSPQDAFGVNTIFIKNAYGNIKTMISSLNFHIIWQVENDKNLFGNIGLPSSSINEVASMVNDWTSSLLPQYLETYSKNGAGSDFVYYTDSEETTSSPSVVEWKSTNQNQTQWITNSAFTIPNYNTASWNEIGDKNSYNLVWNSTYYTNQKQASGNSSSSNNTLISFLPQINYQTLLSALSVKSLYTINQTGLNLQVELNSKLGSNLSSLTQTITADESSKQQKSVKTLLSLNSKSLQDYSNGIYGIFNYSDTQFQNIFATALASYLLHNKVFVSGVGTGSNSDETSILNNLDVSGIDNYFKNISTPTTTTTNPTSDWWQSMFSDNYVAGSLDEDDLPWFSLNPLTFTSSNATPKQQLQTALTSSSKASQTQVLYSGKVLFDELIAKTSNTTNKISKGLTNSWEWLYKNPSLYLNLAFTTGLSDYQFNGSNNYTDAINNYISSLKDTQIGLFDNGGSVTSLNSQVVYSKESAKFLIGINPNSDGSSLCWNTFDSINSTNQLIKSYLDLGANYFSPFSSSPNNPSSTYNFNASSTYLNSAYNPWGVLGIIKMTSKSLLDNPSSLGWYTNTIPYATAVGQIGGFTLNLGNLIEYNNKPITDYLTSSNATQTAQIIDTTINSILDIVSLYSNGNDVAQGYLPLNQMFGTDSFSAFNNMNPLENLFGTSTIQNQKQIASQIISNTLKEFDSEVNELQIVKTKNITMDLTYNNLLGILSYFANYINQKIASFNSVKTISDSASTQSALNTNATSNSTNAFNSNTYAITLNDDSFSDNLQNNPNAVFYQLNNNQTDKYATSLQDMISTIVTNYPLLSTYLCEFLMIYQPSQAMDFYNSITSSPDISSQVNTFKTTLIINQIKRNNELDTALFQLNQNKIQNNNDATTSQQSIANVNEINDYRNQYYNLLVLPFNTSYSSNSNDNTQNIVPYYETLTSYSGATTPTLVLTPYEESIRNNFSALITDLYSNYLTTNKPSWWNFNNLYAFKNNQSNLSALYNYTASPNYFALNLQLGEIQNGTNFNYTGLMFNTDAIFFANLTNTQNFDENDNNYFTLSSNNYSLLNNASNTNSIMYLMNMNQNFTYSSNWLSSSILQVLEASINGSLLSSSWNYDSLTNALETVIDSDIIPKVAKNNDVALNQTLTTLFEANSPLGWLKSFQQPVALGNVTFMGQLTSNITDTYLTYNPKNPNGDLDELSNFNGVDVTLSSSNSINATNGYNEQDYKNNNVPAISEEFSVINPQWNIITTTSKGKTINNTAGLDTKTYNSLPITFSQSNLSDASTWYNTSSQSGLLLSARQLTNLVFPAIYTLRYQENIANGNSPWLQDLVTNWTAIISQIPVLALSDVIQNSTINQLADETSLSNNTLTQAQGKALINNILTFVLQDIFDYGLINMTPNTANSSYPYTSFSSSDYPFNPLNNIIQSGTSNKASNNKSSYESDLQNEVGSNTYNNLYGAFSLPKIYYSVNGNEITYTNLLNYYNGMSAWYSLTAPFDNYFAIPFSDIITSNPSDITLTYPTISNNENINFNDVTSDIATKYLATTNSVWYALNLTKDTPLVIEQTQIEAVQKMLSWNNSAVSSLMTTPMNFINMTASFENGLSFSDYEDNAYHINFDALSSNNNINVFDFDSDKYTIASLIQPANKQNYNTSNVSFENDSWISYDINYPSIKQSYSANFNDFNPNTDYYSYDGFAKIMGNLVINYVSQNTSALPFLFNLDGSSSNNINLVVKTTNDNLISNDNEVEYQTYLNDLTNATTISTNNYTIIKNGTIYNLDLANSSQNAITNAPFNIVVVFNSSLNQMGVYLEINNPITIMNSNIFGLGQSNRLNTILNYFYQFTTNMDASQYLATPIVNSITYEGDYTKAFGGIGVWNINNFETSYQSSKIKFGALFDNLSASSFTKANSTNLGQQIQNLLAKNISTNDFTISYPKNNEANNNGTNYYEIIATNGTMLSEQLANLYNAMTSNNNNANLVNEADAFLGGKNNGTFTYDINYNTNNNTSTLGNNQWSVFETNNNQYGIVLNLQDYYTNSNVVPHTISNSPVSSNKETLNYLWLLLLLAIAGAVVGFVLWKRRKDDKQNSASMKKFGIDDDVLSQTSIHQDNVDGINSDILTQKSELKNSNEKIIPKVDKPKKIKKEKVKKVKPAKVKKVKPIKVKAQNKKSSFGEKEI